MAKFLLVFLFCVLVSFAQHAWSSKVFDGDMSSVPLSSRIDLLTREIRANFETAIENGRLSHDDFEKLDFTFPEDEKFNPDSEYTVFTRTGKIKSFTNLGRFIKKEMPNAMSDRPVFVTLRAQTLVDHPVFGKDLQRDTIALVIQDFDKKECALGVINILDSDFPVLDNSSKIIKIPASAIKSGCVKDANNKYYYISTIVSRFKKVETSETFLQVW